MEADLGALAERTRRAFEEIHERVFRGDPASNPRLRVEVVEPAVVGDTAVLVLITPWTLNGLVFAPGDDFPDALSIGGRRLPVFSADVEGVGSYRSVNLLADVGGLDSPAGARAAAAALAGPFRDAVRRAREEATVADGERREVFKRLMIRGEGPPPR
jgi:hypothetical protein